MPLPFDLVCFGARGTLIDARAGLAQSLAGPDADAEARAACLEWAGRVLAAERELAAAGWRPYPELLAAALQQDRPGGAGPDAMASESTVKAAVTQRLAWPAWPDVAAPLRRLANRVAIGLITDADAEAAGAWAAALGAPVSVVVSSDETRAFKPADAPWRVLLERTRLAPERVLHVATDGPRELAPAAVLGLRTAWLQRPAASGAPAGMEATGEPVTLHAADCAQLVEAVLALDAGYDLGAADSRWPAEYLAGIRLFNARAYYDAHEVWEQRWQAEKARGGAFYKALIQFAVATLHWERGNADGAEQLYREARGLLTPFAPVHMDLDVVAFLQLMEDYFDPLLTARRAGRPAPAPQTARPPQIVLNS